MEISCKTCFHKKVCDLWRKQECQSAKNFFEDECELYVAESKSDKMSNLITRRDAAEEVYKALRTPTPDYKKDPFHDSYSLAIAMVRQIPSAQQWTPVTERLPKERGRYICYIVNDVENAKYIITCKWYPDIKAWFPDYEYAGDDVKAWMPLPEPYEEGKE